MMKSERHSLRNKRFLIVLGHYGHMGGAERQAFHLIKWLRSNKYDVSVLGWTGPGPLSTQAEELGCSCFYYPYTSKINLFYKTKELLGLTKLLKYKLKPDLILPFVSIHSKPLCTIWKYTGAKYCWWNQQDEGRNLYGSKGEKNALLNASDITSNSVAGAEFISATYGIPMTSIKVYNNGTPLPCIEELAAKSESEECWKKRLQISADQKLAVMLANLTEFKDHTTLLHAWQIVRKKAAETDAKPPYLALAGNLLDKQKVHELKALAFDLKLSDCVAFLGAVEDTDQLLYESDLVVHSSIKEGCPNAVCEAMAVGRCVVATDISGCRQALGKDSDQFLASPQDAFDLAKKINYCLSNSKVLKQRGLENRQRISTDFSIDQMIDFFLQTIENGLSSYTTR